MIGARTLTGLATAALIRGEGLAAHIDEVDGRIEAAAERSR